MIRQSPYRVAVRVQSAGSPLVAANLGWRTQMMHPCQSNHTCAIVMLTVHGFCLSEHPFEPRAMELVVVQDIGKTTAVVKTRVVRELSALNQSWPSVSATKPARTASGFGEPKMIVSSTRMSVDRIWTSSCSAAAASTAMWSTGAHLAQIQRVSCHQIHRCRGGSRPEKSRRVASTNDQHVSVSCAVAGAPCDCRGVRLDLDS